MYKDAKEKKTMGKKAFVVCVIGSSLDGGITGPYYRMPAAKEPKEIFRNIVESYQYDMSVMGASSAARRWTEGRIDVSKLPQPEKPIPFDDYVSPAKTDSCFAVINASANIGYKNNVVVKDEVFVDKATQKKYHPIEVLIESRATQAYLNYLREKQISYIFCGKNDFDAKLCISKLENLFGARRICIKGGGLVDYTFLKAGTIDEYAQIILPYTDGSRGIAKTFDRASDDTSDLTVFGFHLLEVREIGADCVLLRYKPENADSGR